MGRSIPMPAASCLSVVLPAAAAKGRVLRSAVKLVRAAGQRIEGELQGSR
jgi:hypothetical protein